MLDVNGLHLDVGGFALRGVDLHIGPGQYVVLMGRTGCGKSLLAQCVCGLIRPDSGAISIGRRDVTTDPPWDRGVGYVPQDGGLWPHKPVWSNIAVPLRARGLRGGVIDQRMGVVVEMLGIRDLLGRWPITLSGGERQKVALARALVTQPHLLVLDEPVSALDEPTRRDVCATLRNVHEQLPVGTLHICHNTEEAETLADGVAIMDGGVIVQAGRLDELRATPAHPAVSRLLGAV